MTKIRPSTLPKLADCPCWEQKQEVGKAAERGTMLDSEIRERLKNKEPRPALLDKDEEAVQWCIDTVNLMSGGCDVISDEEMCKIKIPSFDDEGTADILVPEKGILFDIKSGQVRNYKEQMACYCYGLMHEHFVESWTAYLLFIDQKEIVKHEFTYDDAQKIVDDVITKVNDPEKVERPCDYCKWCSKFTTCHAVNKQSNMALEIISDEPTFKDILSDPEKLGEFLLNADVLSDYVEMAKEEALNLIIKGVKIPHVSFVKGRKPSLFVPPNVIGQYLTKLGHGEVLAALGSMSEKKFMEIWSKKCPDIPIPPDTFQEGNAGKPYVKVIKNK
jgi:hypothetical protein